MGWAFRRRLWLIAVPIASVMLIAATLLVAQRPSAGASTVLTIFTGRVELARGTGGFAAAADGALVADQDRLRTNETGHALITFFDGSTLELEPATTTVLNTVAANANGSITIEVGQLVGRTWASVQKLTRADSRFEIKTPTSTATVRGTAFLTEVLPSGETTVQTTDGIVAVSAQGRTVLVTQGQQITVRPGEGPTRPAITPAPKTTLRFGMHSPASLVVVDPLGRSCGITSVTIVRHIPGCTASALGSEPQIVDVPNAVTGRYRAVIRSIEPGGAFTLTASGVDERGTASFDLALAGAGRPGAVFASTLDVGEGPDGRLTATSFSTFVSSEPPAPVPASPLPSSTAATTTTFVPVITLPALPVPTASPSIAPTRPALRTPAPEPSGEPTAAATTPASPTPSTAVIATPLATAAPPATATPASTEAPVASRPALRTPPPEPTPAPVPTASPPPTATSTSTPTPTSTPTASPRLVVPTPAPGCIPSANEPRKCVNDARD